ncbi:type I-E CRISPR-associated protein Cse1/CasA [Pontiellaceae bacterium B12219]|nr:type I-E CRISPR-associated protein Cse1/CasA [Pontiellaceae bacterium B12219]
MNLIGDPWIPVVYADGSACAVGLKQLFEEADQISDLSVNPPQRIALMRLLLCITQAALDGPADDADWKTCRPRIIQEVIAYLDERLDKFELYGDRPFLQVAGLRADKKADIDKLLETSIGDSALFLEQRSVDGHVFSDAEKALALLVFQNYSAGGKTGQSVWGSKHSESTFTAPCFTNLFLLLRGSNMLDSLWLNLIPFDRDSQEKGAPVWDQMPQSETDAAAFENAYETRLGRMVPFSRLARLSADPADAFCIVGPVPKKYLFSNDPTTFREPYLTLRLSKKNEHYYMKTNPNKHIWRELGSMLCLNNQTENFPALNLSNLQPSGLEEIDVWCGGLARGAQAAKIFDAAEWNFCLPVSMQGEAPLSKYEKGVSFANQGEWALKKSVSEYAGFMKAESGVFTGHAGRFYWGMLDVESPLLLEIANDDTCDFSDWKMRVYFAMNRSFEKACPHETPRQIQAYAQARRFLRIKETGDSNE